MSDQSKTILRRILAKQLLMSAALHTAFFVVPSLFYTATASVLEEIIITARKREESLQDVPVSIQVYSGDAVQEQGIVDMESMAPSIPNFSYSQAVGASDVLVMRGLGTVGSGPHMEQAVGQVFNGYFTTRSRLGRAALFDVAQIEVLRGPQGPIIGKNTSLGAINITSKKPTEETEVIVSGGWDFEASEGYEAQAVISGSLTENIRARIAANVKDKDGWMKNRPTNDVHRSKEDLAGRLIVKWDLTDNVTAELLYQRTDFDQEGKPRELDWCGDPAAAAAQSPGLDCRLNAVNNSLAALADGTEVGEIFTLESDLSGLTLQWKFEDFTVSSLTGYTEYEMLDRFDSDFSPGGPRVISNRELYDQFSQEFRWVSTGIDVLDYIVGASYFSSDMTFTQDFDNHTDRRRHELAKVDSKSYSAFGQLDWHVSETWSLTLGLRYTSEEREALKDQWQNNYGTMVRNDTLCGDESDGLTSCFDRPLADDIDEHAISWNTSLQWEYSSQSMLYIGAATGFKSSGFNIRQNVETPVTQGRFVFDEEESLNIEVGGKHDILDGTLRLNWSLYNTTIDGLQLSSNDPDTITQAVVNGDASALGLEFEMIWTVSEVFALGLHGAVSDVEYDEFLAPCYEGQIAANGCNIDVNEDLVADLQNAAGETPPFAPDSTLVLTADYLWRLGASTELAASVKTYYVDEQMLSVDNDPRGLEDSYIKWDASLTLSDPEGRWKLALVGRNLGDELVRTWSEGTSSFDNAGGARYAFINETRAVALRGQYRF